MAALAPAAASSCSPAGSTCTVGSTGNTYCVSVVAAAAAGCMKTGPKVNDGQGTLQGGAVKGRLCLATKRAD